MRDPIDVHDASWHRSRADLECLGRRHAGYVFSLEDLQDRFAGTERWDDRDYADYGLRPDENDAFRAWASEQSTVSVSGPSSKKIGFLNVLRVSGLWWDRRVSESQKPPPRGPFRGSRLPLLADDVPDRRLWTRLAPLTGSGGVHP